MTEAPLRRPDLMVEFALGLGVGANEEFLGDNVGFSVVLGLSRARASAQRDNFFFSDRHVLRHPSPMEIDC